MTEHHNHVAKQKKRNKKYLEYLLLAGITMTVFVVAFAPRPISPLQQLVGEVTSPEVRIAEYSPRGSSGGTIAPASCGTLNGLHYGTSDAYSSWSCCVVSYAMTNYGQHCWLPSVGMSLNGGGNVTLRIGLDQVSLAVNSYGMDPNSCNIYYSINGGAWTYTGTTDINYGGTWGPYGGNPGDTIDYMTWCSQNWDTRMGTPGIGRYADFGNWGTYVGQWYLYYAANYWVEPTWNPNGSYCSFPAGWVETGTAADYCYFRSNLVRINLIAPSVPPTINTGGSGISAPVLLPNGSTQYTVTFSGDDVDSNGAGINTQYVLINYLGANSASPRGYIGYSQTGAFPYWGGAYAQGPIGAAGGGQCAKNNGYGPSYINLVSCSTSVSGNNRTTTFVITVDPSFGVSGPLTNNEVDLFAQDADTGGAYAGWVSSSANGPLLWGHFNINIPPTAQAGVDQVVVLPTSTTLLDGGASTDPDSGIVSWSWVKISGPAGGAITTPNNTSTNITGLNQGVYVYRLTVTDALGATGTDDIQITVNLPALPTVTPSANLALSGSGLAPGTYSVLYGETGTISWTSGPSVTECRVFRGGVDISGAQPANGSFAITSITAVGTQVYVRCLNIAGWNNSGTYTFNAAVPPSIGTLTINGISNPGTPIVLGDGQTFTLQMNSSNANTCLWSRTGTYAGNFATTTVPVGGATSFNYNAPSGWVGPGNVTWTFTCFNDMDNDDVLDASEVVSATSRAVTVNFTSPVPAMTTNPAVLSHTFLSRYVGDWDDWTIRITNSGTLNSTLTGSLDFSAAGPSFSCSPATAGGCTFNLVGNGAFKDIIIRFAPPDVGSYSANITMTSNDAGSPRLITVLGDGLSPISVSPAPSPYLDFGRVAVGKYKELPLRVTNESGTAINSGNPVTLNFTNLVPVPPGTQFQCVGVDGAAMNPCVFTLPAGTTRTLTLRFTPPTPGGSGPSVFDGNARLSGIPASWFDVPVHGVSYPPGFVFCEPKPGQPCPNY